MEENLKLKYNELLARFKKGQELLEKEPENGKYQTTLKQIGEEMENVLQGIGEFTEEEMQNGFKIEAPKETKAVVVKKEENKLPDFNSNWKMAEQLATSDIIPDTYKNKPQNVIIALGLANQMGMDAFTVMQNLAIIKGKTSWSGSFCKTLIERTGKYRNLELNYVGEKGKDSYGCYLSAERVSDGKIVNGPTVTMGMAKAEGWTSNKKWTNLTDLMLGYRCQSFFCRLYTPEAMNGIYTSEEIEDITPVREQPQDIL